MLTTLASASLAAIDVLPLWLTILCAALIGLGTAPSMGGIATAAQMSVERRDVGSATASLNLLKQLGGTAGLAIGQTMLTSGAPHDLAHAIGSTIAVGGVHASP